MKPDTHVTKICYQTVAAIYSFFLDMCLYPDIQKKAQAEIDNLVGSLGRLPTLSDREDLPYVNALLKEVHRWNPVTPLGACFSVICFKDSHYALAMPHRVSEDDVYENKFIPKGSTVIVNTW